MKKGILLFAAVLTAAALCGCGSTENPAGNGNGATPPGGETAKLQSAGSGENEPLAGGWQTAEDTALSDAAREIFAAAAKTGGQSLTPEKLLATQVVAGINYKFLCRDATGTEMIAVVWRDVHGNCSFLSITEIK